jgi:hypothetical protein
MKAAKHLRENSRSLGRDLNEGLCEYKSLESDVPWQVLRKRIFLLDE